jgi:hypothetical protein
MLNYTFNRIEPIVHGFTAESRSLNTDIVRRRANERIEVIGRAYIARETAVELQSEIKNKLNFLQEILVLDKMCGVIYNETTTKIRFLSREIRLQSEMMEKATAIIELAIEKYHQYIDNDIQKYNEELNIIMRRFTFIAISFLP